MPPAIEVRDARDDDYEVLLGFHRSLYEAHRDRVVSPEDLPLVAYRDYERILADDLRALMRDRDAHVLIAESGGEARGYITGRVTTESRRVLPRRGVVEDWYVEAGARGSGVGKQLLEALAARFVERGCEVIESATWSGNERARRTHTALGFREIRVIYRKRV
jgi:ribosomal protein S18 acetylase RimI-like enzyme